MARFRKLSVISLLLFSTLLWGTLVAGHVHLETNTHLCEICLLPQVASVDQPQPFAIQPAPASYASAWSLSSPSLAFVPHYHSRAPPV